MQRHSVRFIASRICASDGFGFLSSSALAVIICPFWQKPHCGTCSSIHVCCSGCSLPSFAMPSSVVTSLLTAERGMTQDRIAAPLMITVQAPHCPSPQPNRGPVKPISFRRIYRSGVDGSASTVCDVPFTFNVRLICALLTNLPDELILPAGLPVRSQTGRGPSIVDGRGLYSAITSRDELFLGTQIESERRLVSRAGNFDGDHRACIFLCKKWIDRLQ